MCSSTRRTSPARPALYADLRDDSSSVSDESTNDDSPVQCGYDAVREATLLPSARLLSATLDVPADAPRVTRGLREMIDAGYLRDYTLHVPVFAAGATDADLARHLVRTYRSMIVFCATRDEGRAFCAAMNALAPTARYIDCETPRAERREVLAAFKTGALAFIVNVRVLSVGFDAPITKGVCFLRIPASQTLAVQMIGRCLRPHRDKRIAHVVLPLVAAAGSGAGSEDGQHDTSAKKRVLALMRVLAHTDSRFARAMRERGGAYVSVTSESADDLEPDQPMTAESEQCALLHEVIYDSMGKALYGAWEANLAIVAAHYTLQGRMPKQNEPGGIWLGRQRQNRATMSAERKALLDALPWWQWNPTQGVWEANFAGMVVFYEQHGRMPTGANGQWVLNQRRYRSSGAMTEEHAFRLDSLSWWSWDPIQDVWEANFAGMVVFYEQHGRVPTQREPGGTWASRQRPQRATMRDDNRARLDALSWWSWDPLQAEWNANFTGMVAHHERYGRMPTRSEPFGRWAGRQHGIRATMCDDNRARLDALPFWRWRHVGGQVEQ